MDENRMEKYNKISTKDLVWSILNYIVKLILGMFH